MEESAAADFAELMIPAIDAALFGEPTASPDEQSESPSQPEAEEDEV